MEQHDLTQSTTTDISGVLEAMGLLMRALIDSHPNPENLAHAWRFYTSHTIVSKGLRAFETESATTDNALFEQWAGIFGAAIDRCASRHPG